MTGLFFLKIFKIPSHVLLDVFGVDCFALGEDIRVDHALWIKEDKDHLFGPASVDTGFYWACLTLFNPLHRLFFRFRVWKKLMCRVVGTALPAKQLIVAGCSLKLPDRE
jgi:hypothetical protein